MRRLSTALLLLLLTARLCGATLNSTVVWEVNPNTGSNLNSGGFDSGIGTCGTDQTYPSGGTVTSFTDLAATSASTTVTSAIGGFTGMRCNLLRINNTGTGAHCPIGWYAITAVTDNNTATLDRTPTTGGNCVAGQGKIGGATASLSGQTTVALLTNTNALQAGNTIYIKNQAWNEGVTTSGGNSGTNALPIVVEGYNSTRGDAPTGSNRPHNNRAAAAGVGMLTQNSNFIWKHLWVSNAGTIGIQDTTGTTLFVNVRSSSNGSTGFTLSGSPVVLVGCEADTNTTIGITTSGANFTLYGSYLHGNTTTGLTVSGGSRHMIVNNIISANGSHGISGTGTITGLILGNTIDGNTGASTDGINIATGQVFAATSLLLNNIFSNNGRDGVRVTDASVVSDVWPDYNNFSGNSGTTRTNFPTGAHDIALSPGYVSSGTGNFAVGANMRAKAFPGTFPASTSTGYLDAGAVQTGLGGATQRATGCVQ